MNLMKLFLTTLILISLMPIASAQRRTNKSNRPPVINSFNSSSSTLVAPCRWFPDTGCAATNACTITLSVNASDPDGDNLIYKYTVTGGKLNNEGARASWNLSELSPGTYNATVEVSDSRGGKASKSVSVEITPHGACDPPCITVVVTCPGEVEEGAPVIFTANVSGGEAKVSPTFSWTISGGTIIKGQGTYAIEVDTANLGGRELEANAEVGGYPPECANKASCKVQVKKKSGK